MIRRLLSGVPFVLLCLSPDAGGGGGGSSPSSTLNSPFSQAASPQGDTPEAKYTSALTIIKDYFRQLSGAMTEKDEAVTGLTTEKEAHATTKGLLETEKTAHGVTKDSLSTMTGDRDTQKLGREKAEGRVSLLESFAKHHNLDLAGLERFKALKEVPEASASKAGKALYDQWQALKNAGEGKKATAFFRKHKAELNEYAESTR